MIGSWPLAGLPGLGRRAGANLTGQLHFQFLFVCFFFSNKKPTLIFSFFHTGAPGRGVCTRTPPLRRHLQGELESVSAGSLSSLLPSAR